MRAGLKWRTDRLIQSTCKQNKNGPITYGQSYYNIQSPVTSSPVLLFSVYSFFGFQQRQATLCAHDSFPLGESTKLAAACSRRMWGRGTSALASGRLRSERENPFPKKEAEMHLCSSSPTDRTFYTLPAFIQDMRVDHRGAHQLQFVTLFVRLSLR